MKNNTHKFHLISRSLLLVLMFLIAGNGFAFDPVNGYPDCTAPEDVRAERDKNLNVVFSWLGDRPSKRSHFYKVRFKGEDDINWTTIND